MSPQGFCAVCKRTFLVGEAARSYVSAGGRHEVCELCAGRTAELGWLPADQAGAEEQLRADAERKSGFLTKLFARPEGPVREQDHSIHGGGVAGEAAPSPPRVSHELDTERYDVEVEWADGTHNAEGTEPARDTERPNPLRRLADLLAPSAPRATPPTTASSTPPADAPPAANNTNGSERESVDPRTNLHAVRERGGLPTPAPTKAKSEASQPLSESQPAPRRPAPPAPDARPKPLPDPAGRGMRPRRLQPDLSPATRFERAIVRFNAGEAGRTVAGLTRTLGAPSVSVGDLAGTGDIVRVTVAWELTWYQWGVDLGDELRPVYELAKGFEVDEIDSAARQWNASAHDGRIVMVAPGRRAAESGRPVHR